MGLFGGGNSKSKTKVTNTWNDNRQVNDAGGGVVGTGNTQDNSIQITDNSTHTTTDQGAVAAAVKITEAGIDAVSELGGDLVTMGSGAIDGAYKSSSDALDFGRDLVGDVLGLAESVVSQAGSQAETASTILRGAQTDQADSSTGDRTLKIAAVAAVALVAAVLAFAALRK